MSEKQGSDSIRISQVMAGALAAVTAALIGSTMGVAGTVVGAGVASVVSTIGGALYLRSIQRTGQGVRSVRERVVTRTGSVTVTTVERGEQGETPREEPGVAARVSGGEPTEPTEATESAGEQSPSARRLRWPAMIVGSVLAFVLGMAVITGVEWLRGEPLSGGDGTTVGDIVRVRPGGEGEREGTPPPATGESSTPPPETATVTESPAPTSGDQPPPDPPSTSSTPPTFESTTTPPTTTGSDPTDASSVPPSGPTG